MHWVSVRYHNPPSSFVDGECDVTFIHILVHADHDWPANDADAEVDVPSFNYNCFILTKFEDTYSSRSSSSERGDALRCRGPDKRISLARSQD